MVFAHMRFRKNVQLFHLKKKKCTTVSWAANRISTKRIEQQSESCSYSPIRKIIYRDISADASSQLTTQVSPADELSPAEDITVLILNIWYTKTGEISPNLDSYRACYQEKSLSYLALLGLFYLRLGSKWSNRIAPSYLTVLTNLFICKCKRQK